MPPNTRLAEEARARGLDVTTDFRPGVHEWGLWDAQIQDVRLDRSRRRSLALAARPPRRLGSGP